MFYDPGAWWPHSRAHADGGHSPVPLVHRVVVHKHRLDLHSPQEAGVTHRPVVDIECNHRLLRRHIAASHQATMLVRRQSETLTTTLRVSIPDCEQIIAIRTARSRGHP